MLSVIEKAMSVFIVIEKQENIICINPVSFVRISSPSSSQTTVQPNLLLVSSKEIEQLGFGQEREASGMGAIVRCISATYLRCGPRPDSFVSEGTGSN